MNEVWIVIRRDSDGETLIKGVYANRELGFKGYSEMVSAYFNTSRANIVAIDYNPDGDLSYFEIGADTGSVELIEHDVKGN